MNLPNAWAPNADIWKHGLPPFELGPPLETVEDCRGLLGIWRAG